MADWPQGIEACTNCTGGPVRYSYGARGHCNRCYKLIKRMEAVQAWDRSNPATLKGIPKDGLFDPAVGYGSSTRLTTDGLTNEQFEVFREDSICQIKQRLALLHHREEIRRHEVPVDALQLEEKFAQVLRLVRRRAGYPRNASYLNANFNEVERRVIYALLEEIVEQAPTRVISPQIWRKIYSTGFS